MWGKWSYAEIIGVVATFLGALLALTNLGEKWGWFKKVGASVRRWFTRRSDFRKKMLACVERLNEKLDEMNEKVDRVVTEQRRVSHELTFNGDSSLKDAVRRIEDKVTFNTALIQINEQASDRMKFGMDHTGACIFINNAFLDRFGYHEVDVLEFGFEDLVHPDYRKEMRLRWKRSLESGSRFSMEQKILNNLTHQYEECIVAAYCISKDGKVFQFSGTIDIINKS